MPSGTVHCTLCSEPCRFERQYRFRGAASSFREALGDHQLYRCMSCGLIQANHASIDPSRLYDYYRNAYAPIQSSRTDLHFRRRAAAITAELRKHIPSDAPDDIFEVGAGDGITLHALANSFPGTRLSTDEPRSSLDSRIQRQSLEDHPRDAVIMSHVLEHLPDPVAFLKKTQSSLKPRGVLYIEVPNGEWLAFRDFPFDEPHISFFSKRHLEGALERAGGFQPEAIGSTGPSYWLLAQGAAWKNMIRRGYDLYNLVLNLISAGKLSKAPAMHTYARIRANEAGLCLRAIVRKP